MSVFYTQGSAEALRLLGFSKLAGRMEKALRTGEIAVKDLLPFRTKALPAASDIATVRSRLRAPGKAPNLKRLREIRERGVKAHTLHPGVPNTRVHTSMAPATNVNMSTAPAKAKGAPSSYHAPTDRVQLPEFTSELDPRLGIIDNSPAASVAARRPIEAQVVTAQLPSRMKFMLPSGLQHELGEARMLYDAQRVSAQRAAAELPYERVLAPYSSHLGVRATLRESMHGVGDPAVQRMRERIRNIDPSDKYVEDLLRQYGHTNNRPIPLDGKQHARLKARLIRDKERGFLPQSAGDMISDIGPARSPGALQAQARQNLTVQREYLPQATLKKLDDLDALLAKPLPENATAHQMAARQSNKYERLRLRNTGYDLQQAALYANRGKPLPIEKAQAARAALHARQRALAWDLLDPVERAGVPRKVP